MLRAGAPRNPGKGWELPPVSHSQGIRRVIPGVLSESQPSGPRPFPHTRLPLRPPEDRGQGRHCRPRPAEPCCCSGAQGRSGAPVPRVSGDCAPRSQQCLRFVAPITPWSLAPTRTVHPFPFPSVSPLLWHREHHDTCDVTVMRRSFLLKR